MNEFLDGPEVMRHEFADLLEVSLEMLVSNVQPTSVTS